MIKHSPDSRRLIVSAWNPEDVPSMALPPCHTLFKFYVHDGKLSCQLYQRSADVFLGVPFNIASYALLTHLIAKECGLEVGDFVHTLGDAHLYLNHLEAAETLLSREPKLLPQLEIDDFEQFDQVSTDQIRLQGYEPWPTIKARLQGKVSRSMSGAGATTCWRGPGEGTPISSTNMLVVKPPTQARKIGRAHV